MAKYEVVNNSRRMVETNINGQGVTIFAGGSYKTDKLSKEDRKEIARHPLTIVNLTKVNSGKKSKGKDDGLEPMNE